MRFGAGGARLAALNWPVDLPSRGTDFRTHSLFLNDSWQLSSNLTVNLGLRWDKNQGEDAAGKDVVRDSAFSPRLGLVWDPTGEGRWSINGSYGRYVAAIANVVADSSSPAGTPSIFAWFYEGPGINTQAGAPLVSFVLALPDTGPLFLRALLDQDIYLSGAILLMYAALTILGTFLSDVLLAMLDPRIRYGERI